MIFFNLTLVILMSVGNLAFLIYTLYRPQVVLLFLLYIIVTFYIMIRIYKKKLIEYEGLPIYIYFFLPGLGPVVLSLVTFMLYYFRHNSLLIEDYENYIRFKKLVNFEQSFNYDQTMRTIPAVDYMQYFDAKNKKEFIVDAKENRHKSWISALRQGNLDSDLEVQHYSAVTINELENKMNHDISELKGQLEDHFSIPTLDKLLNLFKEYIESSLLEQEGLKLYNTDYIQLLQKKEEIEGFRVETSLELMKAYIRQDEVNLAKACYKHIQEMDPNNIEALLLLVEMDKKYRLLDELMQNVSELKMRMKNEDGSISGKLKNKIDFWIINDNEGQR